MTPAPTSDQQRPQIRRQQRLSIPTHTTNIPPTGDPLIARSPLTIRVAYQNIRGISERGLQLPDEIEAIDTLELDIMGMSETNRPWHPHQKSLYDQMMTTLFRQCRTIYTAAPSHDRSSQYQPGGNLLTVNGRTTGRIMSHGLDWLGRFCWVALRGHRDEGVLLITAYRVCQKLTDNPGPHTAFSQQYMAFRDKGHLKPNPRKLILTDIASLIASHRLKGLRPILMMDANGDLATDSELRSFLSDARLSDPFFDRFGISPRTNINGSTRIDYIFMDAALTPSILRIGYLGTHDGALSDHVMAYVDFDETSLFQGILNRPLPAHSREILIEQDDKVQDFLSTLHPLLDSHNFEARVACLANSFATNGLTLTNTSQYNDLYGQFLELTRGVATRIGRKKYGYARSPTLTHAGMLLITYKQILDCRIRDSPYSPALLRRLKSLEMDESSHLDTPVDELRQLVR